MLLVLGARGFAEEEMVVKAASESDSLPRTFADVWSLAADELAWLIPFRRELHRFPELMFNETVTSARIAQVLRSLDIPYTAGWALNTKHAELEAKGFKSGPGRTGIVADVGTGKPPCVLLRADIDALPIRESPLVPFASENPGKMHACGHDAHAAMLLGAAALLKKREAAINGTIRFIWQPAEEGGAGGKRMVEEGVLTMDPPVEAAFAMHQWPFEPLGVVAGRPGAQMAATEIFDITISGAGGHAALPHLVKDPIVAAAHVVTSLQTIAARETNPLDAAVVSCTMVRAGDAYNVIPAGATVGGTIRSLTFEGLQILRDRVASVVQLAAAAHRCNASISWSPDAYPPTNNDPALFEWVRTVAADASSTGNVEIIKPTMGGEDFSFIAERVPSVFLALGQGQRNWRLPDGPDNLLDTTVTVHSPNFVLNEDVLQRGVSLHSHLALRWLADR
ncbi:hypothetical protein CTAYLR_007273 [Chrysophaeum taylorii]|uniref:Peptidase M20 dimerisation domain-containing protein n=1 Tax=Chrysophaeum taylorii TaxID=2483200 RepID=A0AAD7UJ43_9STRA|nr:hypothetical protein CTAYLR_007273 [Chrysophaeum taylorii]